MKKLLLMIASLFIVTSVAYANPMKSNSIQNDLGFAFGEGVKVENIMILDNAQMSEVQGKGWKKKWKKIKKKAKKNYKKNKKHYNFTGKVAIGIILAPTGATAVYYTGVVGSAAAESYL